MKKLFLLLLFPFVISSCAETMSGGDFTYVIDKTNPLKVSFNTIVPSSKAYGDISLVWEFGDGEQSTETNPDHIYKNDGIYNVKLALKSSKTFIEPFEKSKEVDLSLDIKDFDFSYKVDPENPLSLLFEAKGSIDNGTIEYEWNFGDGKNMKGNIVSKQFSELGQFPVTLIARIMDTNFVKEITKIIEISLKIEDLDFSYNADPSNPLNVELTATSQATRGDVEYEWDFGFGATKKGKSVVHKFGGVGTHNVKVTAKIVDSSITTSLEKMINTAIYINDVDFTFGSEEGNPFEVYFNASGSSSFGDISYEWDFGKGIIIPSKNTSFRFNSFGEHLVTLKVYLYGTSVAQYVTKTVTVSPPEIKDLAIKATPSAERPLEYYFEASGSSSFGELEYEWDFGRGETKKAKNALYTFSNYGDYIVTLNVLVAGTIVAASTTQKIEIPTPKIDKLDFTYEADPKRPLEYFFEASGSSTAGELEYEWNFGRGALTTGKIALHTFDLFVKYKVALTATIKGTNISKTEEKTLNLNSDATIDFDCYFNDDITNMLTTCTPNIKNKGDLGSLKYRWEFDDPTSGAANISTDEIAEHTYKSMGKWNIKLIVESDKLIELLEFSENIYVIPEPTIKLDANVHSEDGVGSQRREVYIYNTWGPYNQDQISEVIVTFNGSAEDGKSVNGEVRNFTDDKFEIYNGRKHGGVVITVTYKIKGQVDKVKTEHRGW